MKYSIKVTGTGRFDGEYNGADSLADARAEAITFIPPVRALGRSYASIDIVRFSKDGLRVLHVESVWDSSVGSYAERVFA